MLAWIKASFWLILALVASAYFAVRTYGALSTGEARLSRRYLPLRDVTWESEPQAFLLAVIIGGGLALVLGAAAGYILRTMVRGLR